MVKIGGSAVSRKLRAVRRCLSEVSRQGLDLSPTCSWTAPATAACPQLRPVTCRQVADSREVRIDLQAKHPVPRKRSQQDKL